MSDFRGVAVWGGYRWCSGEGVVGDVECSATPPVEQISQPKLTWLMVALLATTPLGLEVVQPVEDVDGAGALVGVEFDDR